MTLSDWSESLTFSEIDDMLHVVGLYNDDKSPNVFTEVDRKEIEAWMARNDVKKFKDAYFSALAVQERLEEDLAYAQEISGISYKIPMSH